MPSEIDPQLPFIQVHRSSAAMGAALAPLLGITYQHARGALVLFWESLADRRLLAKALLLPVPMVVLDDKECQRRLQVAFGVQVPPELAATVGILELQNDAKWRVRGMSRYLDAERARLRKKSSATQPAQGSNPGATGVRPPSDPPSDPTKARGERREVRGEREDLKGDSTHAASEKARLPVVVTPPEKPPDAWDGEDFWRWAQCQRQDAGLIAEHRPRDLSAWYSAALGMISGDVGRLKECFLRFGDDKYWQQQTPKLPFRGFMSQWDRFDPGGEHAA